MRVVKVAAFAASLMGMAMGCVAGPTDVDGAGDNSAIAVEEIRCGNTTCALANATARCARGGCVIATCFTNRGDCNHVDRDGCEVNIGTDPRNCGGCGTVCTARPNAAPSCTQGACGYTCNPGFADCDGRPDNGCEQDTRSDGRNCGACGRTCSGWGESCCNGTCGDAYFDVNSCGGCGVVCAAGPHSTANCYYGNCGLTCESGYADCDGDRANGCEVSLFGDDSANCGGCGVSCGADATCISGRCQCAGTQSACYNYSTGAYACTDVTSDPRNCGYCGGTCGANSTCINSTCTCTEGNTRCWGGCVDLNTDIWNCGACGTYCPSGRCVNGVCGT